MYIPSIRPSHSNHPIHPKSILLLLPRNPTSQPGPSRVLPCGLAIPVCQRPVSTPFRFPALAPVALCLVLAHFRAHGSRLTAQGMQIDAHHPRINHASRLTLDPFLSSLYRFRFCFWPCSSFVLILTPPPLPVSLPHNHSLTTNSPSPPRSIGRFRLRLRLRLRPSARFSLSLSLSRSVSLRPFRPDRGLRRIPSFLRPKKEQTANPPNRPVSTR